MKYINIFEIDKLTQIVYRTTFDNYIQDSLISNVTTYEFEIVTNESPTVRVVYQKSSAVLTEEDVGTTPDPDSIIAIVKNKKLPKIDLRTKELIYQGAPWPPQAPIATMSLSDEAQRNWIALMVVSPYLTYPYTVTTIDDNAYAFGSSGELQQFCMYCMQVVSSCINSGRALKIKINSANTIEDINAIVDNR